MNHNTLSQLFAKPAHLCKAGCCLYALLWLLWAGTLQAVQLTNIRGEFVPDGSPVIVSSYADAKGIVEAVPEYMEAGKGPGFINVMATSGRKSMAEVRPFLTAEEEASIARSKTFLNQLKAGDKLPTRRIVVRGHASLNRKTIVSLTEKGAAEAAAEAEIEPEVEEGEGEGEGEAEGAEGEGEAEGAEGEAEGAEGAEGGAEVGEGAGYGGKSVNVSPEKLGKRLGPHLQEDTDIDMTVCFACEDDAYVLNDFTKGLHDGGARGIRIRAQEEIWEIRPNGRVATGGFGNELGTVTEYVEGKALNDNPFEGGRVIEEDGTIREATGDELEDWSENGIHQDDLEGSCSE